MEDRYYSKEEYAKLTPEQKQALHTLREKRGPKGKGRRHGGGRGGGTGGRGGRGGGGGRGGRGDNQLKSLKRKIASLKAQLTDTKKGDNDESEADGDEEVPMKAPAKTGTNAKHRALTRQS
jgi:hypothetical protein